MSTAGKLIIASAVVLLIVLGGFYYWKEDTVVMAPASAPEAEATSTARSLPAPGSAALPSGPDSSNAALDQDLSAVDAGLSGLSSDTASISGSLSDTPVSQSTL